jgi:hypothetical protein
VTSDVFFISYDESNREENWKRVLEFHPHAKQISNIKGISDAHIKCNKLSSTRYFWTIDGDNWLLKKLTAPEVINHPLTFFQATDCIDQSISSVGSVKLWKKHSFINNDMSKGDFCKYATKSSVLVEKVFSIHKYDASPYEAWRHTFRHTVKCITGILPQASVDGYLLNIEKHKDLNHHSYRGYLDGKEYAKECAGDFTKINLINDFDWLKSKCSKEMQSPLC